MSQRSPFPRGNNVNSVESATVSERAAFCRNSIDSVPVTAYLDGFNGSTSGSRGHAVADVGVTLPLLHLDVVLAIAPYGPDPDRAAERNAILSAVCLRSEFAQRKDNDTFCEVADIPSCIEDLRHIRAAESTDDPVIKRLSDALAATESADDRYTEICADALRLAIVTRLLGLQSDAQRSTERTGRVIEGSAERQMRSLQKWRLKRVFEYVDNHLSGKITLLDLAEVAGLSRMHFAAQFRAATGFRPHEYLLRRRIQRAEELLRQSTMTLVEIALTVGFQTQAHFTTVFKRFVGDTPYQWRNAHCVSG
jgi:AraC family transcriptional regulator